jgi:hypothetical protein
MSHTTSRIIHITISSLQRNTYAGWLAEYLEQSSRRLVWLIFVLSSLSPLRVNDELKPSLMQSG